MDNSALIASQRRRSLFTILAFFALTFLSPLVGLFLIDFRPFTSSEVIPGDLLVLVVSLAVGPIIGTRLIWRTSARFAEETFDPLFAGLHLEAAPYLRGRQYHGEWKGRHVDIYVYPLQRQKFYPMMNGVPFRLTSYLGHSVEIFVESTFGGQILLSTAKGSAEAAPKALSGAFQKWKALANSVVLLARPGAVHLQMILSKDLFSSRDINEWLESVSSCAVAVEKIPVENPRSETSLERYTRLNRGVIHRVMQWGCLAIFAVLLGLIASGFFLTQG